MYDLLFVGVPLLGSLLLLGGSVFQAVQTRRAAFAAPALIAVMASAAFVSSVLLIGQVLSAWVGGVLLLLIGLLAFRAVRRRVEQDQIAEAEARRKQEESQP